MPFNVRSQGNPSAAADNWSKGVQASGAKLASGYANPRRDPKANPAASATAWQAGVANAAPAYQTGIASYNADAAIASMNANGVSRYTQAATTKKANYANVAVQLIPAIQSAAAALPADRSTPAARDARMLAMVASMRGLRGKYRKGRTQ